MNIGMEQLVWAIIFIIFIIITILKNRARKKTDTTTEEPPKVKKKAREQQDRLGKYLEEILGVEIQEPEPQKIIIEEEKPRPLRKKVTPITKPEKEEVVGEFESPLMKEYEEKEEAVIPEKKELYQMKFPWGTISKENLPGAIIFAEIIGPPISKRKSHRLF
ncbi:MAG: hypothetical protein ACE5GU_04065 [Candidatus Scalinduaceae bacterium]